MTDEEQVQQALAELWDVVKCRCNEAYTGRGLHDPDCECDSTDAVQTVATAITTLRAQLADALEWNGRSAVRAEKAEDRAERAEAALAAQIEVDAGIITSRRAEMDAVGDALPSAVDRAVFREIVSLLNVVATAIRNQPHDRTALDRYREKALLEAADELRGQGYGNAVHIILALIEKPNAR